MTKKKTAKKDPFTVKKSVKPKVIHQRCLVRKVGNEFEVTNGTVKFKGSDRMLVLSMLLALMDQWENNSHQKSTPSKKKKRKKKA